MSRSVSRRARKHWSRFLAAVQRTVGWSADPGTFGAGAPGLSAWTVGRHLEHLLLSDRRIVSWLETVGRDGAGGSEERPRARRGAEGTGGPTAAGWLVLVTGFIPRGRGRAPEFTVPTGAPREEVEEGLREMRERVAGLEPHLEALSLSRATLRHPALGGFTAIRWLRFAGVHHAHHEKIVREILRAKDRA